MKSLTREIENLNTQIFQDNKRLIEMLSSLQTNIMINPKMKVKNCKENDARNVKQFSIYGNTPRKTKKRKESRDISCSFQKLKRFNSTDSTGISERCT